LNKVIPLLAFGIGLIVLGLWWHFYSDVINMFILPYALHDYTAFGVHYTHDKYFDFMYMVWRIMPWILLVLGVFLLLLAGVVAGSGSDSTPEGG